MDITDIIGRFGKYQTKLVIICWFRNFVFALSGLSHLYITRPAKYQCDFENRIDLFSDKGTVNNTKMDQVGLNSFNEKCYYSSLFPNNETNQAIPCTRWTYQESYQHSSIVQEWNLVCSQAWLVSFGFLLNSVASFVSFVPSGHLSDRVGRRKTSLLGMTSLVLINVIISLSNYGGLYLFLAMKIPLGISFNLMQSTSYLMVIENIGANKRFIAMSALSAWGLARVTLSGVSWLVPEWRYLFIITNIPLQIVFLFIEWRCVPESCRWLVTRNRDEQAKKEISKALVANKIVIKNLDGALGKLKEKLAEDKELNQDSTFLKILKQTKIRKIALIICFINFSRSFVSRGFEFSLGQLSGSFRLNFALFGISRCVQMFLNMASMKYLNRRMGLIGTCLITTICFSTVAIAQFRGYKNAWLEVFLSLLGHTTLNVSSALMYYVATEVFPTNMRSTAQSVYFTFSRIGAMLSPFPDLLGRAYGRYIPSTIFGILTLICALVSFILPETKNSNLPDTITESKKLVNGLGSKSNDHALENIKEAETFIKV